ncbi:hypothetical protein N9I19_02915 [Peribacillus sp. CSMR9]|nr:hypothetical protein [Peribacillus sp. CSMR9]
MYKHNNICFTGILQLIELGKVNWRFTCVENQALSGVSILQQKENSADAESQLEI